MEAAGVRTGDVCIVGVAAGTADALRTALAGDPLIDGVHDAPTVEGALRLPVEPAVVVLDVRSVADDLATAISALREGAGGASVVALSDHADPALVRRALESGAVSFLVASADPRQLRGTVTAAMERRGLLDVDVVRPVIDVFGALLDEAARRNHAVIQSLAAAVEAKDSITSTHLESVTRLARQLAQLVDRDLARAEDFAFGCLLHDVGKIGVPGRILTKPGPLTIDEWKVMRLHPETGARIVGPLGLSKTVVQIVKHHHERWDGGGYPDGLRTDQIPLVARIFSICDALEAMTARRPYRLPMPPLVALGRVLDERGGQFDPEIVDVLERGVARGEVELLARLT